jgi:ferredoxin
LSAQLLRLQYEIRQPLCDSALSSTRTCIPHDEILTTAKSIRRTCLAALRDQFARFQSRELAPILPPPRFRVKYCPFADQLRKDLKASKSSTLRPKKARPSNRHDDREICPHCDACISVTAHSGLPAYRGILFTSHIAQDNLATSDKATFACNSCYKTFDDSYAFLDHIFQKQIGSNRSCLRKSRSSLDLYEHCVESNPSLVEQCLKNCLTRELTRMRTQKKLKSQVVVQEKEIYTDVCDVVKSSRTLNTAKPLPPHPILHRYLD